MDIKNLNDVQQLFASVNANGNFNSYFLAFKDNSKATFLGGAVGAMIEKMDNPYDAILINSTELGIGMFFMSWTGVVFGKNVDKLQFNQNPFFCIPANQISKLTIKKFGLNSKVKSVYIESFSGQKFQLMVDLDEKQVPYHKAGFEAFMANYAGK